ncbi:MAG: cytochrome d ubiquinol oxidase subunit II [Bacteroidales bacterium]|nr:cytochrome d ubiquinol oxidase subunit II [Bacteroidales bacterium]
MFENLSLLALQHYWWIIISILGALLVFLLFVQGGQTMIYQLGKTEDERKMLINSTGRKWDLTFTTLVTFGGAFFASFPLFYSTSFGGAYWVWMAILFAFILQAVSYEFRTKTGNFLGQKTYEGFLFINGLLGTVLLGAAVATFFTGSQFSVDKMNLLNLTGDKMPIISAWETPFHGLEAIWDSNQLAFITNLSLGLAVFFLARLTANLYFINNIDNETLHKRNKTCLLRNSIAFLLFFLLFLGRILTIDGFAVNPDTKEVFIESFKYFNNLIDMPFVLVMFLVGVVLVLYGIGVALFKNSKKGIWASGIGIVFTVMALFFLAGFNNTAYYPSVFDLQSSLTIENSSSSHFTLTAMSYVSLLVPFVLGYIAYAWWSMDKKKITIEEVEQDHHMY